MLAVVLATLSASALSARAERASWHGTLNTDAAATDNVFSGSDSASREVDLFFQIRPGLMFTYGSPRMLQELSADLEILDYTRHSDEPSVSARGGWRSVFVPGPRSEASLSVAASTAQLAGITSRSTPDESVVQLQPTGNLRVMAADVGESMSYVASREWNIGQSVFARWNKTDDEAMDPTIVESAEAGLTLTAERSFVNNSFGLELGGSVLRMERVAPVGAEMGSRLERQIVPRARLQWRHDIDKYLSTSVDGGAAYVIPYGTDPYNPGAMDRHAGLFPIAGVQGAYTDTWGLATLSFRRDVSPNMLIAQNTVNDSAILTAAVPLPWLNEGHRLSPRFVGMGVVGYQRTKLIDTVSDDLASSFKAARIDVGVMYTPRPGLSYGARYEFMYQTGDTAAAGNLPGFWRNTIFATLALRYPAEVAAEMPKRRKNSMRADKSDQNTLGAEPVVPGGLD